MERKLKGQTPTLGYALGEPSSWQLLRAHSALPGIKINC